MLQFVGLQRVGLDWVTEQQQHPKALYLLIHLLETPWFQYFLFLFKKHFLISTTKLSNQRIRHENRKSGCYVTINISFILCVATPLFIEQTRMEWLLWVSLWAKQQGCGAGLCLITKRKLETLGDVSLPVSHQLHTNGLSSEQIRG